MNIDDVVIKNEYPHYTELKPILWGSFNLSQTAIPFFQMVLTLEEATQNLKLVENLPSDLRANWKLEELFQREIDWERVKLSIVNGYLRRPEKLKFFNSLTVALLPVNENKMLASEYGETIREPESKDFDNNPNWTKTNIGGVQLFKNKSTPIGYLRWDPKRIFPATIDGQHRLASLQTIYNEGNLPNSALDTKISVIFLVLDERVGFDISKMNLAKEENPILTVVREVFIDLNKHAEEVNRSREILLNDQQIECRCLRQLIAQRIGEEPEGRLPLGVVHWQHNVTAKFNLSENTAPFITTVELLYAILVDLLDLSRPKDPLDAVQVRKFVESIEDALEISKVIEENPAKYPDLKPLFSYVEKHHLTEGYEVPFVNLNSPYLKACEDGFERHWRPLIFGVLTFFKPYKDFISEVRKRGGISGELESYLVLPRNAQKQQITEWGESKIEKIDKPLAELAAKKKKEWPFFAVFQKGLMRASASCYKHSSGFLPKYEIKDFMNSWIAFLDDIWDRGFFSVRAEFPQKELGKIWSGIALNLSETVRWSESDVQRISALISLWWYFYNSNTSQVTRFVNAIKGSKANEKYPESKNFYGDLRKGLRGVVSRNSEELDDDEIEKRIEKRIKDLIFLSVKDKSKIDVYDDDEVGLGDVDE